MKEKGRIHGFGSQLREVEVQPPSMGDDQPVERQIEYVVKEHLEMTYPGICDSNSSNEVKNNHS